MAAAMAVCGMSHAAPMGYAISSDDGDRLYQIDLATGTTTLLGTLASPYEDIEGLAIAADGRLLGIDDATKTLLSINTATAAISIPGGARANTGLPTGIGQPLDPGISFACDGRLLLSSTRGKLYELNQNTGAATAIGGNGITMVENITDIAVRGMQAYGLGYTGLYKINANNGTSTLVGAYGSGVSFSEGGGMAFDQAGNLWAIADRSVSSSASQIFRIDINTGKATAAGSTNIRGIESLAISVSDCSPAAMGVASIPVSALAPRNLGLGLLLLAGLGLWQLRRR
jgi:hypothetical protein